MRRVRRRRRRRRRKKKKIRIKSRFSYFSYSQASVGAFCEVCVLLLFKQTGNIYFTIYSSHCLLKTKTLISHGPLLYGLPSNNSVRQ